ncbi:uncharacterized protein DSM5745_03786 [Aspergillus mulundensis]|uniref:Uncharacterized protein n=1 Tax=Aspergillus mulundensis TaxID=1810919 RepID=A0A3D8SLS0_9EURO|nr:Uncharacterized protein DSM5745_03786 [Aspergillus mulundensis]RDW87144.1 Uncharacterized protein DSM5745_03786 [Aspergillus mulundensis]
MDSKTNGIDDFPDHWKVTLLGEEFWKDAENWNKDTNDRIEAGKSPSIIMTHDQSLHTRFPFNIGPEQSQTPRVPCIITTIADLDEVLEDSVPLKRSRRFSMSDALGVTVNLSSENSGSTLQPPSRVLGLDLRRRSRSRSRSRYNNRVRSSSVTADIRRSSSMIRSTFNRLSGRRKLKDEEEEAVEEIETELNELELETQEELSTPIPEFTPDQATPANPLMEFRGGALWAALPKDRRTLGLDVFWPNPADQLTDNHTIEHKTKTKTATEDEEEEEEPTILPIDEMSPLCTFRNLRVLKITGMMQSYQMHIFQAAWLNTDLEELEIGMALSPRLRRGYKWPYIKGGWRLNKATYGEPVYHGTGEGTLLPSVGVAEYLDKMCLEKAKIRAMAIGSTRNRLSIRTLILTGVVVDADPFLHWFDPKRLKCINFKDNCVDAGFYLSHCMEKVSVLFPRQIKEPVIAARRVDLGRELKVIRIEGGKKVGEIPYRGLESLKQEIPRNMVKADDNKEKEGTAKG